MTDKRKNDDKAKGRPRRLGLRAALVLMVLGGLIIVAALKTIQSPSPDQANRLIYSRDGQSRFALDVRTGQREPLTGVYDAIAPTLSPDGQWSARWLVDGNSAESWLELNSTTKREQRFPLKERVYGTGIRVNWSPDSQWIAFHAMPARLSPDSQLEVWRVNIETGVLERLTNNFSMDRDPDFSPDGTQIVYTAGKAYLAIMTLETGKTHRISSDAKGYRSRWSPDGRWIAFSSVKGGTGQLWIVHADGTDPQMVVPNAWWSGFEWEH